MRTRIALGAVEHMVKWEGANFYVVVAARSGGAPSVTVARPNGRSRVARVTRLATQS